MKRIKENNHVLINEEHLTGSNNNNERLTAGHESGDPRSVSVVSVRRKAAKTNFSPPIMSEQSTLSTGNFMDEEDSLPPKVGARNFNARDEDDTRRAGAASQTLEAGVIALTQLTAEVKKRVENLDNMVIPEVRTQLKIQNDTVGGFKRNLDAILGAVKCAPKPQVPGRCVIEECTDMEKAEAARRDAKRQANEDDLAHLWTDIVTQDPYLAKTHLSMARENMEKKLGEDGRRAEAEILIQEMLDRFRSNLEKEYADRIKATEQRLREEAHAAAWERLFQEIERQKRELEEKKERELKEEKERLLDLFRQDFEAYQNRATELQNHLKTLLEERNNLAKDMMALQLDYKRFIEVEKGPDQWQFILEMRDYQVRETEEFSDKWTPLVMPETLLAPRLSEDEDGRGKVVRDPALSPRDSRDMTGNALREATPELPDNLTEVPAALREPTNGNQNYAPTNQQLNVPSRGSGRHRR